MKKKSIVVVGSSNTDMVIRCERIPRPGETVLGGAFSTAAGGKGANQAVAAARAGGDVVFVSRVGDDSMGQQAIEGFVREGIGVKHVVVDRKHPSGVAFIAVDARGENSIAVAGGANQHLSAADIRKAREELTSAAVVVMQLEVPLASVVAAARIAHTAGACTILNPAPACPLPPELLQTISILTPNESEASLLTGITVNGKRSAIQAATRLQDLGVGTVMVTMGAKGVLVKTSSACRLLPAFPVKVVDTTAAGDVFNGALAVALAEDRAVWEAVTFANAAAALSVTCLGAQPSAPRRRAIVRMVSQAATKGI